MKKIFIGAGIFAAVGLLLFFGFKTGNWKYMGVCLFLGFIMCFVYHRMMTKAYGFLVIRTVFLLPLEIMERAVYVNDREEFDRIISIHRKRVFHFKLDNWSGELREFVRQLQGTMLKYITHIHNEKNLAAAYKKAEEANATIWAAK